MTPEPPLHRSTEQGRSAPSPEAKSVADSFRCAWEGVMFVLASERHMRAHFTIMGLVLLAAWGLSVSASNLLHLLFAAALVLITEMVNTAIEATLDLLIDAYNPKAKVVKDVAAGAVLIAALYAVGVAALIFLSNERLLAIFGRLPTIPPRPHVGSVQLLIISILIVALIIGGLKKATGRGRLLRGGVISGHTALGFLVASSIIMLTDSLAVAALGVALALLVAQSRVQAQIHSTTEVLVGALIGTAVGVVVFLWPAG